VIAEYDGLRMIFVVTVRSQVGIAQTGDLFVISAEADARITAMGEAFFWGFFGGAALLLGAAIAYVWAMPPRVLGAIMAFGSGVLISAVAFELVEEANDTTDGNWAVALGLGLGAIVFFAGDWWIDRRGGADRKSSRPQSEAANGPAILFGTVLDGLPESIVIGLGLIGGQGVSVAMIAAVFLSNLPEAIGATSGLKESGWRPGHLFGMWLGVAIVSGLAALFGYAAFDGASDEVVALVLAFAGGALLTMLVDTMVPESFELNGPVAGLLTTLGFGVAYAISAL
jgi:ZIP family zinc transporter